MVASGLAAGFVWLVLGTFITAGLARPFAAIPGNRLSSPSPGFLLLNIALDLLEGISIIWLYAAIRPRYGPGPQTALRAAWAWWCIVTLADVTWMSFGLFPASAVIPLILATLPALIIATLVGGAVLSGVNRRAGGPERPPLTMEPPQQIAFYDSAGVIAAILYRCGLLRRRVSSTRVPPMSHTRGSTCPA